MRKADLGGSLRGTSFFEYGRLCEGIPAVAGSPVQTCGRRVSLIVNEKLN